MTSPRPRRILIVDASEDLLAAFGEVLEFAGYETATARGLDEALERIQRERPDLVLTDVMMKGPEGLELITRIRSDLGPPIPAILACSGFSEFREKALRRGALWFLTKPIQADDLVEAVQAALGGEQGRARLAAIGEKAEKRSNALRQAAVRSAATALEALAPRWDLIQAHARGGVTFLSQYLALSYVSVLLIEGDRLGVLASTGLGAHAGFTNLALEVLESQSTLVLPDASRFVIPEDGREAEVSLFVGIPLFGPGRVAIGVICAADEARRNLDAEDLALLSSWGRSGSFILGGAEPGAPAPMFPWPGLLSREALASLIRNEDERARRSGASLELAVLKLPPSVDVGRAAAAASSATTSTRRALAALDDHTLGILLVRTDRDDAARELSLAIAEVWKHGLTGAGLASLESRGLPFIDQLLVACERIAERGALERIIVRGERLAPPQGLTEAHP